MMTSSVMLDSCTRFAVEHRWGTRRRIDLPIRLDVAPQAAALLLNASSSGAYVRTDAALPLMTRVCVEFGGPEGPEALGAPGTPRGPGAPATYAAGSHGVPAYVVRTDAAGFGLEWCTFGSAAVLTLLEAQPSARWNRPAPPLVLPPPGVRAPRVRHARTAALGG